MKLPPSTLKAGEKISWISVVLCDRHRIPKPVEKSVFEAEDITITFMVRHLETGFKT